MNFKNKFSIIFRKLIGLDENQLQAGFINKIERDIWIENTLNKLPSGIRILDAGAGELQYKKFCSHLNYVSQDFAQYDGEGDKSGLQTGIWDVSKLDIISDITHIPEPDNSFDAIMCIEVFEHLPNPIQAIIEFARLLKPGGFLIITAPFCSLTHFSPYHFYSGFNKYFYEKHLNDNGFKIEEITANENYFKYIASEMCRIKYVSSRYTKEYPTRLERYAILIILKMLKRMNDNDKNSSELLCSGYHVFSRKKLL